MSTRSTVIVKFGDKDYRGIYCHWDGYPDGVGKTLKENFNSLEMAKEIVELGDCSCIAGCVRIKPIGKHTFNAPEGGTIIAYHRDRGEKLIPPAKGATWKAVGREIGNDFNYIFENGSWHNRTLINP